ncbi:MAG: hypothetical protein HQL52_10125 [Magnetococcales bacterium]|nr:hypothetical protein [Magnetococcales bacterium]
MTLAEIKVLKKAFEADGRQAGGIHLTAEQAKIIRRELHHLYGFDPGEGLTTIYGVEVVSVDAPEFRIEE